MKIVEQDPRTVLFNLSPDAPHVARGGAVAHVPVTGVGILEPSPAWRDYGARPEATGRDS